MTYSIVCDGPHEPSTLTVQADSDDQALEMLLVQEKAHLGEKHPEMNMTDDQAREHIKTHWTKS